MSQPATPERAPAPEDAGPAAIRRRRRIRRVDFTRPTKFTAEQQRRLEHAHENWCRGVSTRLSTELRVPLQLQIVDIGQLTWTDALGQVPEPSLWAVVEAQPLGTRILMTLENGLVLSVLDRLLGGPMPETPHDRELSQIDSALAGRVVSTMLEELGMAYAELADLTFELRSMATERTSLQLASTSEPTLTLTIEVKLPRGSSTILLLLPHRAVEAALEVAVDPFGEEAAQSAEAVGAALGDVDMCLRAELGSVELSLEQVVALRPGDLLTLDHAPSQLDATLYVDEVELYKAKLGRSGPHRAVQVLRRTADPDPGGAPR